MQNSREIRGSKWSEGGLFQRILVKLREFWAHLSAFSSNSCSKAVQNDRIRKDLQCRSLSSYRTFALKRTIPAWPGRRTPGRSQRTITEPASLVVVVKLPGRSVSAEPEMYRAARSDCH